MPRYTIQSEDSPISIAYGSDDSTDYFLSVFDKRLKYDSNASDEVNKVTEKIGVCDGGGSYFDLHTGHVGFGHKVSKATMGVFLKRYGVSEKRISDLFSGKTIGSPCRVCKNLTTKMCAKCHQVFYCEKACQTKDWSNHKIYCSCLPFPAKTIKEGKSVYGIFLPENGKNPVVVEVPIKTNYDPEDSIYYSSADMSLFFGKELIGHRYMSRNSLKPERKLIDTLLINFRDDFLADGSKPNTTVHKLTNGLHQHNWKGPILVTKKEGKELLTDYDYKDIEIDDFENVVDFFLGYGLA